MKSSSAISAATPTAIWALADGHLNAAWWGVLGISMIVVAATFTLELVREYHVHQEVILRLHRRP